MAHIDPIGTLLLPLLAFTTGAPIIGWAKPVPVSVMNLAHPRRDFLYIAAAGPASNIVLAVIAAVAMRALPVSPINFGAGPELPLWTIAAVLFELNLLLAIFNMVPVPPLDGGNVLAGLLPEGIAAGYDADPPVGIPALVCAPPDRRPERAHHAPVSVSLMAADRVKPRVVSGMRPTGKLHLGHLVGALRKWAELQADYDCMYFVADWHALTSEYGDTTELTNYAFDNVADWIAAGLDPERSTFFVQSLVPEHAELYLLLSMVVPIPWLERVPTYKEQIDQLSDRDLSTIGFLGYPLLQGADVVIYGADYVPVGQDQVPHLELTREVVRRFHGFFGELFSEPQPLLTRFPRLPGLDNRKMSKSYGNTIDLSDDADTVRKKVMRMYTDPKRIRADIPGTVEGNPVFIYHDAFNPDTAEVDDLKARYRAGRVGDVEVKDKLARALNAMLEPMRERRAAVRSRPGRIREILEEGSSRARAIAQEKMQRVREAVRLSYSSRLEARG